MSLTFYFYANFDISIEISLETSKLSEILNLRVSIKIIYLKFGLNSCYIISDLITLMAEP